MFFAPQTSVFDSKGATRECAVSTATTLSRQHLFTPCGWIQCPFLVCLTFPDCIIRSLFRSKEIARCVAISFEYHECLKCVSLLLWYCDVLSFSSYAWHSSYFCREIGLRSSADYNKWRTSHSCINASDKALCHNFRHSERKNSQLMKEEDTNDSTIAKKELVNTRLSNKWLVS